MKMLKFVFFKLLYNVSIPTLDAIIVQNFINLIIDKTELLKLTQSLSLQFSISSLHVTATFEPSKLMLCSKMEENVFFGIIW